LIVKIYNRQKDLKLPIRQFKRLIGSFLISKNVHCAEVAIHFISKKKISELHQTLFNDESPTDCISIPIDTPDNSAPYSHLGEVFVCPKVAIEYGGDPFQETLLYVIHGLLHLLGFDDINSKDRKVMRKEEKKALRFIATLE
jgi:probable rRNA maturation factor